MPTPTDILREEHRVILRALVCAMEAGEPAAREHIDKENGVLFPLADAVLDEAAQRTLQREFEAVEAKQGRAASIPDAEAAVERLTAALAR